MTHEQAMQGRLMPPYFRAGDYSGGITAAAWQIAKYIADSKGVTLTGQPQIRQVKQSNESGNLWVWLVLAIILFMILAEAVEDLQARAHAAAVQAAAAGGLAR